MDYRAIQDWRRMEERDRKFLRLFQTGLLKEVRLLRGLRILFREDGFPTISTIRSSLRVRDHPQRQQEES